MDSLNKFESSLEESYFPYRIDKLHGRNNFTTSIKQIALSACILSDCYASGGFQGRFLNKNRRGIYVFHFVKQGELEIIDGTRTVGVQAGELVLFSDAHLVQTRQLGPARALALNIPAATFSLSSESLEKNLHTPISYRSGVGAILFALLNGVAEQQESIVESSGTILDRSIIDFTTSLLFENTTGGPRAASSVDRHYARILDCIHKHLDKRDLTIDFVAAWLAMSRSYLCMILSTQGKRFERIVMELRLERSRSMLCDQIGLSMADIAERVGFASASHFSRSFSQAFGMPPIVFRKRFLN